MRQRLTKHESGKCDVLYRCICLISESLRGQATRSVNTAHICANWLIGREIVEEEQRGEEQAEYVAALLKRLSARLASDYGTAFSVSALNHIRSCYLTFPSLLGKEYAVRVKSCKGAIDNGLKIRDALRGIFAQAEDGVWEPGALSTGLSWTHYRALLKVERNDVRNFHKIEAVKNGWSARQLEPQINSPLYERLLRSQDKEGVLALANEGLVISTACDAIKDPYVLEFLDLPESERLVESRVEAALLSKLQAFLLEFGIGFVFVARQQRLTLDGDHFYPDLIFYHIHLRYDVIIDLKVDRLSHADLGQMLMYVNYHDREIADEDNNLTIGLILCTDKNDAMARYVLDEKHKQIFTSRYKTRLPSKEDLRMELGWKLENLPLPESEA